MKPNHVAAAHLSHYPTIADKCIRGLSRSHFFSSHRYRNKCDVIIQMKTA